MDKKTFIDKIKMLFSEIEDDKVDEVKLIDLVTVDGVTLRVKEELAVGVQIYVVAEDGSEVAAPEGEHIIEDMVIVTDAEGIVTEIKEVEEAPVEETVDETIEEEMSEEKVEEVLEEAIEEEVVAKTEIELINDRITAMEKAISDLAESMSSVETLEQEVAKLSAAPADKEIKLSKVESNNIKKNDKFSKLRILSKYNK